MSAPRCFIPDSSLHKVTARKGRRPFGPLVAPAVHRPRHGRAALEQSSRKRAAASCTSLGWLYDHPRGRIERDDARAAEFFRRGCDGNDVLGCANLGVMYEYGRGVQKDEARAAMLYRRACDEGNAQGCTNLGVMYDRGSGGVTKDEARAVALYRRGCDGGHAHGCANLGIMYEFGLGGLTTNADRAAGLYRDACDRGNTSGCANLKRLRR